MQTFDWSSPSHVSIIHHHRVTSPYLSPHEWPMSDSHNGRAVGRSCLEWTQEGYAFVTDTIHLVWNLIEEHPKCTYTLLMFHVPCSMFHVPCCMLHVLLVVDLASSCFYYVDHVRSLLGGVPCSLPVRRDPKEANTTWESREKWVWKANDMPIFTAHDMPIFTAHPISHLQIAIVRDLSETLALLT